MIHCSDLETEMQLPVSKKLLCFYMVSLFSDVSVYVLLPSKDSKYEKKKGFFVSFSSFGS